MGVIDSDPSMTPAPMAPAFIDQVTPGTGGSDQMGLVLVIDEEGKTKN